MTLIEQIKQLQAQGFNELAIVKYLREQNISPKEINDALSQVKIKSAISEETTLYNSEIPGLEGMQQSVITQQQPMQGEQIAQTAGDTSMPYPSGAFPTTQELGAAESQGYVGPQYSEYQSGYGEQQTQMPYSQEQTEYIPSPSYQTQGGYADQGYGDQGYGYAEYSPDYATGGMDTMNEVAEQVVNEKISDTLKKIEILNEFKAKLESQISTIDDRLQKIENLIDNLQSSIVKRIGNYAQDVQDIKSELSGMQDSFSKVINPLTENIKQIEKITKEEKRKAEMQEKKEIQDVRRQKEVAIKKEEEKPKGPRSYTV